MGIPMALRLVSAGHELSVWNRSEGRTKPLIHEGAIAAGTPAEAELGADAVITMLFDDQAYQEVIFGPNGLVDALSPGGLHISCSTISVALSERLTEEYAKRDIDFVGAPVFGQPSDAGEGQLWVVAGGTDQAVNRARPILQAFSRGITVIGKEPKQAHAVRLGASFLLSAMMHALGETLVFADRQGIDLETFIEAVNNALFQSPIYAACASSMLHPTDHASTSIEVAAKDLRLLREAAASRQTRLSLTEPMAELYAEAQRMGLAREEWAVSQYRMAQHRVVKK